MWHRDGPTFLTDNVWVGISFDGTKLWQASFVHFAVGDLGSQMPLGSWILLRGSEKKAVISQLAEVYDLNADLIEEWLCAGMICPIVRPPPAAPRLWAAWRAPASAQWAFSPREQPPHGTSVEEGKGREVGAMVLGSHSDPGTDRHRCGVGRREEG